ncbi:hypothetical protein [Thioalkalivibrio sp. HL-Eb18]|uniref:hypothetical protein n=1 Tax=Thioalkalivibrio sp. HL-Eb18 TaxID=1266913 RepID=UPI0009D9FE3C|nr:hypothetical protein [Thioalkalivibrio sp. HL-Eb18]
MGEELKTFNEHQADVRNRANSLARAVFLLSGGTLSLSITVFLSHRDLFFDFSALLALKLSWWVLFLSSSLLVVTLTLIIVRDYRLGERWRLALGGVNVDASGIPGRLESWIWGLGISGLSLFIVGFLLQAHVATSVLDAAMK